MISGRAGGHDFVRGVCACGRKLVDLRDLDPEKDTDKEGIAHTGKALRSEIEQINALVKRMDEVAETLLGWK
jgi:hypothetical protein